MNGRGQYGSPRVGQTAIEPRYAARRRAVRATFDMYAYARAPYYVYAEVNGIVDKRPVQSFDEARAIFSSFAHAPGEVYAAVFDASDVSSWPGPSQEVYRAASVLSRADRPNIGFDLPTWAQVAIGPLASKVAEGHELTDEEVRKVSDAGNLAIEPLVQSRSSMMRDWKSTAPLTRDQMTKVMNEALKTAREVEKNVVDMIAKVPSHWETLLTREGGLSSLRAAIAEAPMWTTYINASTSAPGKLGQPVLIPGFRDWINHLLGRSESGVAAVAGVSEILPNWLRMRELLSSLYAAAVAAIGVITTVAKAIPTLLPKAGIIAAVVGGVAILGAVAVSRGRRRS